MARRPFFSRTLAFSCRLSGQIRPNGRFRHGNNLRESAKMQLYSLFFANVGFSFHLMGQSLREKHQGGSAKTPPLAFSSLSSFFFRLDGNLRKKDNTGESSKMAFFSYLYANFGFFASERSHLPENKSKANSPQ